MIDCQGCKKEAGASRNCAWCAKWRENGFVALGGQRAYEQFTQDGFKPSKVTYDALQAAKTFDPIRENLYFHGPTGTGKSHLAAAAARAFLPAVITVNPQELISKMLAAGRQGDEWNVTRSYSMSKVLVIDEMGLGEMTTLQATKLYLVLNRRYQDRSGGLIVTSNLSLEDLATAIGDDRLPSRLAQMCKGRIYNFAGEPDHRLGDSK